ncbi:hypothetical protein [Lacrimispora sp.]|uniref:hypothetical protein n=1 Tax=Lacrimispora sp. TaxID=2719234 RepID=UPI0028AC5ED4|nr:hypothetical protein [Lacrimispora sp.]
MLERTCRYIMVFIICIILSFVNEKYHLIVTSYGDMVGYQFNIFTISTVFAGFAFTSLGTLLGMSSENLMIKLKDTTVITDKSKIIVESLLYFCMSGFISLFYVVGIDGLLKRTVIKLFKINPDPILNFVFLSGIVFLVVGIIYFIISVRGVYELIIRVYGSNTKKYEKMKEAFDLGIQEAIKRDREMRDDSEKDEFTKE